MLAVLKKRFEKYGLTLHPNKTRLMDFGRKALVGLLVPGFAFGTGDSEIHQLHGSVSIDENILRSQIAMNDVLKMCRLRLARL